jgi:predicted transcriptional regulator
MSKDIQEQLREATRKSELSCYRISQLADVTESQLSYFLNHKRSLTLDSAAKLAEILGLELKKGEGFGVHKMTGRKKQKSEKIQLRISQRLKTLRKTEILSQKDYDFLWKWTHELFQLASMTE